MNLKELGYEDAVKPRMWPAGSVHPDHDIYDDETPDSVMEYHNYHIIKLRFQENPLYNSLTHLIFPDICLSGFDTTSCNEFVLTFFDEPTALIFMVVEYGSDGCFNIPCRQ